jgi:protein-tyrosine phosphatase
VIDIHTHILPGLDDGAEGYDDALNMARAAVSEGITTIIATPHHANGSYTNLAADVRGHVQSLNERFRAENVPVAITTGQEIRVHDDLLEAWQRQELLTLADSRYILLELPSSRIPRVTRELIHELLIMNVHPIIAHPERNAEIVQHPERLAELVEAGAYAQVTTHSLLGGFGKRIEQSSWKLLRMGVIHTVSSDAHHIVRRGFRLREAYDAIERTLGEQWVERLQSNARQVVENGQIAAMPTDAAPSSGGVRRFFSSFFKK